MLLDLSKIRGPRERYEKVYQPEAFSADRDSFQVIAPVSLSFDIVKDKSQFQLVGRVTTTLELPCSRCLEPFAWPVQADFDLRYQPHSTNVGEAEREIEEDDLATAFYENDEIDLGQLMREQFYLSLPMKPLCRDACLGLCPLCGTNLNRGTCDCKREWEDPRMAVLKTLTTRNENS
ncbi:MAG TPA: DUF177 domain-containing protein [Vicinamibacterales bacterium]|jgi:uncharacterized protein|nr:DUF177 domain-containing protein [Vicinamibacterales bacterium]